MAELIIQQRRRSPGGRVPVGRVVPFAPRPMVGPYIVFDHIGPIDVASAMMRSADAHPHPHIGLSSATYLFSGQVMHRDSLGHAQTVRPNEVGWTTAGRGIVHSERVEHGECLHGIRAWVALPAEHEDTAPGFSHHADAELPQWCDGGVHARLIAGSAYGFTAAVATHSPQFFVHLDLERGATASIPDGYPERAVYIATGAVALRGVTYRAGTMLVLGDAPAWIWAIEPSTVMLLGGEPVGERFLHRTFVSSSRERIAQAAADWKAARAKLPDVDAGRRIRRPASPGAGAGGGMRTRIASMPPGLSAGPP